MLGFLHKDNSIAGPGFNRWLVPPAALCIHLCIGQAYAFSVFNLPMSTLIGITEQAPEDWRLTELCSSLSERVEQFSVKYFIGSL